VSGPRHLPAVVLAVAGLVAACGGGGGGGGTAARAGQELYDWVDCMRAEEIDVPTPTRDDDGNLVITGDGFDIRQPRGGEPSEARFGPYSSEDLQDAQDVCGLPPMMAPGVASDELRAAERERLQAFADCMRRNGVPSYPDPDLSEASPALPEIDQGDPQAAAAAETCDPSASG
jgi:hypothetical protein